MATTPKLFHFTVKGASPFPFDMLRYDSCHPADTESAYTLSVAGSYASIHAAFPDPNARPIFRIRLISSKRPTLGRWVSFLWAVESIEERRY